MGQASAEFRAAMIATYMRKGWRSFRQAAGEVAINHTSITKMMHGEIPSLGVLLRWATAIGEPVNKWLELAGMPPITGGDVVPVTMANTFPQPDDIPRGISEPEGEPPITIESQDVPQAVHDLIAAAETSEDKIAIAFNYVKSIPGIRFGAHRSDVIDTRIRIVRQYELITGKKLLPPEVR